MKYEPEPEKPKRRISYWHLWIPLYGVLVIYGFWHFFKLVTGYRGSFFDLVMSFEHSVELYSPMGIAIVAVVALIVVLMAQPRPKRSIVQSHKHDEPKDSPQKDPDDRRPAA